MGREAERPLHARRANARAPAASGRSHGFHVSTSNQSITRWPKLKVCEKKAIIMTGTPSITRPDAKICQPLISTTCCELERAVPSTSDLPSTSEPWSVSPASILPAGELDLEGAGNGVGGGSTPLWPTPGPRPGLGAVSPDAVGTAHVGPRTLPPSLALMCGPCAQCTRAALPWRLFWKFSNQIKFETLAMTKTVS